MKKFIVILVVIMFSVKANYAQGELGVKVGVSSYDFSGKNLINKEELRLSIYNASYGFEFGMYGRIGILGLNVQPELTFRSNTVNYHLQDFSNVSTIDKITSATYNRIDVPVLLMANAAFFKFYLGPVGQYEFDYIKSLLSKQKKTSIENKFYIGYQLGLGISLNGLTLDLRYESNFSDYTDSFQLGGKQYNVSNRPSRYILSLWFKI